MLHVHVLLLVVIFVIVMIILLLLLFIYFGSCIPISFETANFGLWLAKIKWVKSFYSQTDTINIVKLRDNLVAKFCLHL